MAPPSYSTAPVIPLLSSLNLRSPFEAYLRSQSPAKPRAVQSSPLLTLPTEIVNLIIEYLPRSSQASLSQSCAHFFYLLPLVELHRATLPHFLTVEAVAFKQALHRDWWVSRACKWERERGWVGQLGRMICCSACRELHYASSFSEEEIKKDPEERACRGRCQPIVVRLGCALWYEDLKNMEWNERILANGRVIHANQVLCQTDDFSTSNAARFGHGRIDTMADAELEKVAGREDHCLSKSTAGYTLFCQRVLARINSEARVTSDFFRRIVQAHQQDMYICPHTRITDPKVLALWSAIDNVHGDKQPSTTHQNMTESTARERNAIETATSTTQSSASTPANQSQPNTLHSKHSFDNIWLQYNLPSPSDITNRWMTRTTPFDIEWMRYNKPSLHQKVVSDLNAKTQSSITDCAASPRRLEHTEENPHEPAPGILQTSVSCGHPHCDTRVWFGRVRHIRSTRDERRESKVGTARIDQIYIAIERRLGKTVGEDKWRVQTDASVQTQDWEKSEWRARKNRTWDGLRIGEDVITS